MAGLKKPTKRESSNPNTVLVVFLVFFVLLAIGLGIWGYYGYAGQEKLLADAKKEKQGAGAAKLGEEFALFVSRDARLAFGLPLDADELLLHSTALADVATDSGRFSAIDAKLRTAAKQMITANKTALGYDEAAKKYLSSYQDKLNAATKTLDGNRAQLATAQAEVKAMNDNYNKLQAASAQFWKDAISKIDKSGSAALKAAQAQTEALQIQLARNEKLEADYKELFEKSETEKAKLETIIKRKDKELTVVKAEKADINAPVKLMGDVHALLIDMSSGKTLWDHPLGKITRVDLEQGHVYISIGASQKAKPGLTFNIFAAGANGLAAKQLKGTLEVSRVLDANTSLCRITSLYDIEGREITDTYRGRVQRESENALKEGDLLFNIFWGARVAIAGNVNLSGIPADSPAEQMRNLTSFMHLLRDNGVIVDAFLDLTDSSVQGSIDYRTRYLILGSMFAEPKDGKGSIPEREKAINEAIRAMRKDAADRGMFVISAENTLNVIGYRRRSASEFESTGFRPTVISAPLVQGGLAPFGAPAPEGK